jgi:hypothetical protein
LCCESPGGARCVLGRGCRCLAGEGCHDESERVVFINNVGVVVGMIAGGTEVVCIVDDDDDGEEGRGRKGKGDARVGERASERIGSKLNQLPRVREIRVLRSRRVRISHAFDPKW